MKTLERESLPLVAPEPSPPHNHRPLLPMVLVAMVALLVGLLGGWLGAAVIDDDPDTVWVGGEGSVAPDGATSSVIDEYVEAWRAGCGGFDP